MSRIPLRWILLFALTAAATALATHAHQLGQSYIFLRLYDDAIHGRFEITVADLNKALDLELATDHTVSEVNLAEHLPAIQQYLLNRVSMQADGTPTDLRVTGHDLFTIDLAQYVHVHFVLDDLSERPHTLTVDYGVLFDIEPDHRGLLVIEHDWQANTFNNEARVSLIFDPSNRMQQLDLTSSSVFRGFMGLFRLGVHHIWVGIDHILFLMALLLPSVLRRREGKWEMGEPFRPALVRVIKIVTLFTIAHSVTLSVAALGLVRMPSRLVESIIAVSIAIAALDIIYPVFKGQIWWVVFVFGLFHGFGFASVLGNMGISSRYMALSLLGFNLGVEAGQAVIVCAVFPILFLASSTKLYAVFALRPAAGMLIVVSLYWFVERAFDVDLPFLGSAYHWLVGLFATFPP